MANTWLVPLVMPALFGSVLPARSQTPLPEGPGRQVVESACVQCHELNTVPRAGYSEPGWRNKLRMMINVGATLPEDQFDIVTQYLATHFPEKPKPPAVVMPSPVTICSGTPTMLAVTWGGSILLLARPVSGRLPGGPQSQQYGIVAVKDGLWYSEAGVKPNMVVHFDPNTETFQNWVIPSGGGVVRNMDVTRDGDPVLACSGVNGLAVVHVQ